MARKELELREDTLFIVVLPGDFLALKSLCLEWPLRSDWSEDWWRFFSRARGRCYQKRAFRLVS